MSQILRGFEVNSATWFYLAFLLALAVYFRFNRLGALRNLDLVALLCLTPGWLLLERAALPGTPAELAAYTQAGYLWLLAGTAWWLIRMLADPLLTRRPMLEANMSPSGLTFLGVSLLAFLIAEVIAQPASGPGMEAVRKAVRLADPAAAKASDKDASGPADQSATNGDPDFGPAWPLLHLLGVGTARVLVSGDEAARERRDDEVEVPLLAARTMAILGHLAVLIGLVLVAYWHFGQRVTGVALAVLYLLLPYTAYHVSHTDQVLPGALLIWAILAYRHPLVAGIILGLAAAAFYFPMSLLPLWVAFYWKRGAWWFVGSMMATFAALLLAGFVVAGSDPLAFPNQVQFLTDLQAWQFAGLATGIWQDQPALVIPAFVVFVILCLGVTRGRQPKNLATLIAHSAAVTIGTQIYMPQGGTYVLWYLPAVLLAVFRPNLSDRVAPLPSPRPARTARTAKVAAASQAL